MIASPTTTKGSTMAVTMTKGPLPLRVRHNNIMRNSLVHTIRALTQHITPNAPLIFVYDPEVDRATVELLVSREFCSTCGRDRRVIRYGSAPGFCAGTVDWADLSCGHQIMQDNSYLED
jgi:hypothetical protein